MKIAVVTPYYKEDEALLRQAHDSVLAQAPDCRHVLVADGHPQAVVDGWDAWHVRLAQSHGDYGGTPRGMGALMAAACGFEAVAFLDADNWYEPDHLASLAALHRETGAAVCTSGRKICAVDGAVIEPDDRAVDGVTFVDTNCLFIARAAFHLLPFWVALPRALSACNDRLFWMSVCANGTITAHSARPTANYRSFAPGDYMRRGLSVPREATRDPRELAAAAIAWCRLRPREKLRLLFTGAGDAPGAGRSPESFRLAIGARAAAIEEKQFRDRLFALASALLERARRRPAERERLDRVEAIYRAVLTSFPDHAPSANGLGVAVAARARAGEPAAVTDAARSATIDSS